MPEQKVVITYEGRDQVSRGLKSAEASLRKTSGAVGGLSGSVKGLTKSLVGPAGLIVGIGAVGIAVGAKLIANLTTAGAEISRMSQSLGISTDTLQKWSFAASQTGTDITVIADASRTFSERILEAVSYTHLTLPTICSV